MDGAKVGVLEEPNKVGLRSLLESHDSRGLEAKVCLEILGDLPHQALEWQLADEELSRLLVLADLPQGHSARAVPMWLLDSSRSWSRLPSSLGGQLLPGSLSSSGLAGGLLRTSHVYVRRVVERRLTM